MFLGDLYSIGLCSALDHELRSQPRITILTYWQESLVSTGCMTETTSLLLSNCTPASLADFQFKQMQSGLHLLSKFLEQVTVVRIG